MTLEERIQSILGQKDFALASMGAQIEQLQIENAKLKEALDRYEPKPAETKSNGKHPREAATN